MLKGRMESLSGPLRARERLWRNHSPHFFMAIVVTISSAGSALAQPALTLPLPPFTLPFLPPISGDWTVAIGGGGELKPDFEGAKHDTVSPVPTFSIHRAGSPERFRSPRDGAGVALVDFGGLRAGAVGKFKAGRNSGSYAELNGLGDTKFAVEIGGFAEYFPVDWFRTRVELRRGFGGHNGVVADSSADLIVPVLQRFSLSGGPRFTVEDAKATAPYFSIDAAQALASGLPVFNAKGGAHSVGAGAQARYRLSPQWEVHSYIEYDRLLGSTAASPLVTLLGSPNQTTIGLGASYSFDVRVR
jgi:outer membrane protein